MIKRNAATPRRTDADMPLPCVACPARPGICSTLSPGELRTLSESATRRFIRNGTELSSMLGDGACAMVRSGTVRMARMMADGRQQVVGLRGTSEMLGRPLGGGAELSAKAVSDLELCVVPGSLVATLMDENRTLERFLYARAVRDMDEAHEMLLAIGRKTARERVATFLLNIARGRDASALLAFTLSRAEIGDCLGLTVETVSRQIGQLRNDGLIDLASVRHFRVPDLDRLAQAAGC